MPLKLMLVQDMEALGDNGDLFVTAETPEQAAQLWRAYYALEPGTEPERVIEVPKALAVAGSIPWDAVEQHKRPCPGNRHRDTGRGVCADCEVAL